MIKNFPKILIPFFLILGLLLLMIISGIFGFTKETEGYFLLVSVSLIAYVLIPVQIFFLIAKVILMIFKKFKSGKNNKD